MSWSVTLISPSEGRFPMMFVNSIMVQIKFEDWIPPFRKHTTPSLLVFTCNVDI